MSAETALRRSARDPLAFAELYEAESEGLLLFLAQRTLDGQAALDLCAEALTQAFAGRRRFRGRSGAEARAFLYAIAHRDASGRHLSAGTHGGCCTKALRRTGANGPGFTR